MKNMKQPFLCSLLSLLAAPALAQAPASTSGPAPKGPLRDLYADTWVATDALGRGLPLDAPAPRADKVVGMFYFIWHGGHGTPGPFDISRLLAANPEAPALGGASAFHWWGEPEAGYYRSDDAWVIRRNLSMLADAGVDVIFCDVTNAFTYPQFVKPLCDMARAMRAGGNKTPQVAFITHAHPAATQQRLWDEFYSKNLYSELWFHWQGKPLILGVEGAKFEDGPNKGQEQSQQIRDFFTWRYSWAWDAGPGKWQWIDNFPQDAGLSPEGRIEQMPVAVASHPTSNIGRSYHNGKQPPIDRFAMTPTYGEGLHFAEQWTRALEVDPSFIFVDGWNEWVAQRFVVAGAGGPGFLGKPTKTGDSWFVDAYNAEFNRDIEPMKGGSGDNLYYQMIANVRRFKGARPIPIASAPRGIDVNKSSAQWNAVGPEFRDERGDTLHRDHAGWGELKYLDASGRNDIVASKVARDAKNLYFLARTAQPLSPVGDARWMMLFIDADKNAKTGWNGYDFLVNDARLNARETAVSRWQSGAQAGAQGGWKRVARARFTAKNNELQIALPLASIGQSAGRVGFDFKWVDNANPSDMASWFVNGDSAPPRRFNYRYQTAPVQWPDDVRLGRCASGPRRASAGRGA